MEECERQLKKQKVEGEEDHECKTQLSPALSNLTAARRKFNIHFTTFWHLAHLTSVYDEEFNVNESWMIINAAGAEWKRPQKDGTFFKFDNQLAIELSFMDEKISRKRSITTLDEKSLAILQNFDKCLSRATMLADQVHNDEVDALAVCVKLVHGFVTKLANFKMLPLLWGHLFVSHIYQLLFLAKDCCHTSDANKSFGEHRSFAFWFDKHAASTAELREHFSSSTKFANLVESRIFSPAVPLDALIATLKEEAKCAAQQIPTAVTSIVHEYCHFDPFNLNDAELLKMKFIASDKVDKIKE